MIVSNGENQFDPKRRFFGINFSGLTSSDDVMQLLQRTDPLRAQAFRYVVTPNADHIVRLADRPSLRNIYNGAWLCLNDSRVLQLLLRTGGFNLPVIRGSDLVSELLNSRWIMDKRVIVIGGGERVSAWLRSLPGPKAVFHHNPPMGFIHSREAVDEVVDFIEQHLPAVIFLAVGSPNQELVADRCRQLGLRGGLAFCIGAGILMAAGIEKRAPPVVRTAGFEWLYRLSRNPRRLAARYFRDVRILRIVAREIASRHAILH
jgi:N-acetylglucosaminyldiphosphoundecaprenol N-acetyl-beta-D-mannosaminyltransferase